MQRSHRAIESRKQLPYVIYALACPRTLDVRYVGQTSNLAKRVAQHTAAFHPEGPIRDWLLSLGSERPIVIVLERGTNRSVRLPVVQSAGRNRKAVYTREVRFSTIRETVWMMRHQRTILNHWKVQSTWVAKALTNPPLPWDESCPTLDPMS